MRTPAENDKTQRMKSRRHLLNFTGAALLAAALIAVFAPGSSVQAKAAEEVYDLVLFFGQSNMVGSAMGYTTNPFTDIDPAIASEITGIDEDLIENTVRKIFFHCFVYFFNTF